ncbi:hypothetical protein Taro_008152 [Colocasia esculenta]|uniref:Uncharacterized protein n=1 Tax=Colocasia esculenta TaxID=4460 RepID=A0A843U0A6_COLES|nr:hypothetical protein [Colocasia esculenta]
MVSVMRIYAMASRGRRGGASAREDEPRRDERAEQQAPAPPGPVLPPPPPVDYGVFMQGLVQAMQTQAHTQAALQAQLEAQTKKFVMGLKPSLRTRLVAFDHRTLDEALSAAYRQEGEMEQYLEEKKASQKRPAATFQRRDKKKMVYQTPQRSVRVSNSQVPSIRSPGVKKECPHCGKTHGGSECWLVAGRCLKCGSSDHKIKDSPRLQQGAQRGAPAVAAAAPATGRPGRPRAPARSQKFRKQGSSPIGELSPMALRAILSPCEWERSLSHMSKPESAPQPLSSPFCKRETRGENPISDCEKTPSLQPKIRTSKALSGVLLQLEARGIIEEGLPDISLLWRSSKSPEEGDLGGHFCTSWDGPRRASPSI